jgi:hypothetical protein
LTNPDFFSNDDQNYFSKVFNEGPVPGIVSMTRKSGFSSFEKNYHEGESIPLYTAQICILFKRYAPRGEMT